MGDGYLQSNGRVKLPAKMLEEKARAENKARYAKIFRGSITRGKRSRKAQK